MREAEPGRPPDSAAHLTEASAEVDRYLQGLSEGASPQEAAHTVAVAANRAAAELHKLARAGATARRGEPDWGAWAGLQNAARALVLQSSTARDLAAKLAGKPR